MSAYVLERHWPLSLSPLFPAFCPTESRSLLGCSATRSNRYGLPENTQSVTHTICTLLALISGFGGIDDTLLDHWRLDHTSRRQSRDRRIQRALAIIQSRRNHRLFHRERYRCDDCFWMFVPDCRRRSGHCMGRTSKARHGHTARYCTHYSPSTPCLLTRLECPPVLDPRCRRDDPGWRTHCACFSCSALHQQGRRCIRLQIRDSSNGRQVQHEQVLHTRDGRMQLLTPILIRE